MATSTGPDLSGAREAVERLMDDTCTLRRNAQGLRNAVLDPVTSQLVDPTGDTGTIYVGKCKIKPRAEAEFDTYDITMPLDAPLPIEGDVVHITSARRDQALVGRDYLVRDVVLSSFAIQRKMTTKQQKATS